ncbi:DUF5312 family protein [Treponema parvum]|uniref:DUF5312 family protein n=1 Tax=Treponema parvum TaxID=138851 RepID=UPI001AEC0399|nr:DUF5312 family protein [Treponema parvum]QTQ15691.1 hypothetical protein HXT04_02665 [Treponema parvum]
MAENKTDKTDNRNFIQKIIDSIFGIGDPEVLKKKQLKSIAKDLSKSHFNFYKFSSDEVLPSLAKFFYQIYKIISPAQTLIQSMNNPAAIKNSIVMSALSEDQLALSQELSEPAIREKTKSVPVSQLSEQIHQQIDQFVSSFDMEKITKIDLLYASFQRFQAFCTYDYFFLLKKFCPTLKEHDFTVQPHFESINSKYVKEDIKDFVSVALVLEKDEDWSSLFSFFKDSRGTEPLPMRSWTQILSRLHNMKRDRIFEKLIKLIDKDPFYEISITTQTTNVVEPFIEKVKNEALQTIQKLHGEQKKNQIDGLLTQLFGTEAIARLKNYTEEANSDFIKHKLPMFAYCQPLNYLKAFLLDFVKADFRAFADLVLVRGQWTSSPLSTPMSEAYNDLLDYSKKITEFDEKLAEDNEIGIKIKTLMPRTLRERDASNIASTLIEDANDAAKEFLVVCTQNLITIGKTVKTLLEDYAKMPRAEIIINWKELEHFSDEPIKDFGVRIYKKIYLFTQLMQTMIGKK